MSGLQKPIELFCSYAHEDESLLQKLETHLSMLKRQGLISTWYDRQITAGTQWARAIDAHLNSASVILLLISPDFFASDYCYGIEMMRALARHKANEARVIPILLRPVDWKGAPFAHLQALPTNAKPITTWSNRDEAFANVVTGIRRAIEDLAQLSASDAYGEKPVSEPQGAGKYQINIHGPISGLTIGDHNQVTSNFGNTLGHPTAPEQVGSPKGVLPQVSFGEPFPKIWNVPRRHTSFFTGRDHVLEQIADGFRLKNKAGMVPYFTFSVRCPKIAPIHLSPRREAVFSMTLIRQEYKWCERSFLWYNWEEREKSLSPYTFCQESHSKSHGLAKRLAHGKLLQGMNTVLAVFVSFLKMC